MDSFFVYITVNCNNEIHDIGVTIDIMRRFQLIINIVDKSRGKACKLVYYEEYCTSEEATVRESQLKDFPDSLLKELIEENNPAFTNLIPN